MRKIILLAAFVFVFGAVCGAALTPWYAPPPKPPAGSPVVHAPLAKIIVTSPYGRRGFGFHSGIDLRAREGTPLSSIGPGVVERVSTRGPGGKSVVIKLDSGWRAGYAHMSRIDVKPGQRLRAGAPLGLSGSTGRATGPHLHLEMRDPRTGRLTDPAPLLGVKKVHHGLMIRLARRDVDRVNREVGRGLHRLNRDVRRDVDRLNRDVRRDVDRLNRVLAAL